MLCVSRAERWGPSSRRLRSDLSRYKFLIKTRLCPRPRVLSYLGGRDTLPVVILTDEMFPARSLRMPAQSRTRRRLMSELTYRLFIDGEWVDADGPEVVEVRNPATEEVIGRVPQASATDVDRAVAAARRAFDDGPWPRLSPAERGAILLRMVEIMERRLPELIDLNIREAGSIRPLAETIQVGIPIAHFR